MRQHIGICDRLPLFRSGLKAALASAAFEVEEPPNVVSWAGAGPSRSVMLSLSEHRDWNLLDDISSACPGTLVVTLLEDPTPTRYCDALSRGARTALPRSASLEEVVHVMRAALAGQVILPAAVVKSLSGASGGSSTPLLSNDERLWLRLVGQGVTVEELAWQQGYSRRTMYRRLDATYRRLGTSRRSTALLEAARRNLI